MTKMRTFIFFFKSKRRPWSFDAETADKRTIIFLGQIWGIFRFGGNLLFLVNSREWLQMGKICQMGPVWFWGWVVLKPAWDTMYLPRSALLFEMLVRYDLRAGVTSRLNYQNSLYKCTIIVQFFFVWRSCIMKSCRPKRMFEQCS